MLISGVMTTIINLACEMLISVFVAFLDKSNASDCELQKNTKLVMPAKQVSLIDTLYIFCFCLEQCKILLK